MENAALLRQKGYPQLLIDEAYVKARDKGLDELLKPADRSVSQLPMKTYMTTTYNPSFDGSRTQVKKTWDLLDRSSGTRHIHTIGLQVGYRRPKNLRDHWLGQNSPPSWRIEYRPYGQTRNAPTVSAGTAHC